MDLSQVTSPSYAADVLVLVRGAQQRALAAIVVEVQLKVDSEKRKSWPVYLACARREHDCPAFLLVVSPDEKTARWAEEAIEMGHPGFRLAPLVVGPASVPKPPDLDTARRLPELAVLATLARPEEEAARTAIMAVVGLEEERARLYLDVVFAALPQAIRFALEAWMQKYEYQSDFARRYLAEGLAEGRVSEARSMVVRVLARRGFDVPPEARRQIEAEQKLERLERWLDLAVTARTLAEVFSDA